MIEAKGSSKTLLPFLIGAWGFMQGLKKYRLTPVSTEKDIKSPM